MNLNRSIARLIVVVAATAVTTSSASAGWSEFWFKIRRGYHRNNAWPDPFTEMDVRQVVSPFEIMKHNGWRLHNTISHELFREGDGALLASGNERVRWIATQAPDARRSVYILRAPTPEETQARVASVQRSLAAVDAGGAQPRIFVTDIEPGASSGAWANKINTEWLAHLPIPQLPQESATGNQSVTTASGE